MGCAWSANREPDAEQTAKFNFLSRRFAAGIRRDFVTSYNRLSPDGGCMRVEDFSDKNFRLDEKTEKEALEDVGIRKDLLPFVVYHVRKGPADLPHGVSAPELGRVLCDLDAVDAPSHAKRDFVDIAARAIKSNL